MEIVLEKIVNGGQALGTSPDGKKIFVWGGLPGETVQIRVTKKKSKYLEGVVEQVIKPSPARLEPVDPESYLSTSPWQIIDFKTEQNLKAQLVDEAFLQHHVSLPVPTEIYTDNVQYAYRNKVEFSWYSDLDAISGADTLDLAFFRRGSRGKVVVDGTSLAREEINILAREIRDLLRTKNISARQLKTLLIRCDQTGGCVWQLYTKDKIHALISDSEADSLSTNGGGGEVIYSDPRSPASVITERLASFGQTTLEDTALGVPFRYATEGFFQINLPVYEQALKDMAKWINRSLSTPLPSSPISQTKSAHRSLSSGPVTRSTPKNFSSLTGENNFWALPRLVPPEASVDPQTAEAFETPSESNRDTKSSETSAARVSPAAYARETRREAVSEDFGNKSAINLKILDLYSGVGSIGLTIGGDNITLIEVNQAAVAEMQRNIKLLGKNAKAVLAPSEKALEYITTDRIIIVDPPRAGLHTDVIDRLLDQLPPRIIYLSCNPVTQARDVALLLDKYQITHNQGYNFFPRTPHIENLVVLDKM